ncbi:MAG: phage terminase large subunit family protein [Spirochaetes bacterium]|nr:phage terminase large subunit family protein [Spirochaetota bacterium]
MTHTDREFFRKELALLPSDLPPRLISEYVQGRRIMPPDTPFPGYWDNRRTPYLVEIMDDMSPFSPITHSITMKARKLGVTAAAENVVAYWVDANPTAVEYVTATDELAEAWSTRRWDPVVDSLGFRHKMAAQTNLAKSRRTGDKVFKKEFVGGYLDIISSSSKMATRAGDIRVLVRDEIDGRPPLLVSGEGYWTEVNYGHTASWGARKKVMDFSSPTTTEISEIARLYALGDQRKFLVPCPFCHRDQELVHLGEEAAHGIKAETNGGVFIRAYYLCEFCHEAIFDWQKTEMLAGGHWQPTKPTSDPTLRSRQISSLYSPFGMLSWNDYWRLYMASLETPDGARAFTNLYRGLPYAETGARPDLRKVIALRGTYKQSEVQPGAIYLTAAVDVQRGKDKPESPEQGARLEMEVLGHGRGYKTWSVDFRKFFGKVDDPYSGAWEKLDEWATKGGLLYKRADGMQFTPAIILIDSSDGQVMNIVYGFCRRWNSTFPCKGAKQIVADAERREKGDIAGTAYKRWRILQIGDVTQVLYEVNTQFYKAQLYNKLGTVMRRTMEPQANGFQDFPRDYDDEYFAQLVAEEQLSDGSFKSIRARNEALDCRVYNMAAGDIYLMGLVEGMRRAAREKGATVRQAEEIGSNHALAWLEARIQPKAP